MRPDFAIGGAGAEAGAGGDHLWRRLKNAAALCLGRGAAVVAQLLVQVVVGALASASGLGVLQLVTSWTSLLGEALARGLPTQIMRHGSVALASADRRRMSELVFGALARTLKTWIRVSALLGITGLLIGASSGFSAAPEHLAMGAGVLVCALAFALLRIGAEALKAEDAPLFALTLENLSPPAFVLLFCSASALLLLPLTTPMLLVAYAAGLLAALLVIGVRLRLWARIPDLRPHTGRRVSDEESERRQFWFGGMLNIAFLHLPFLVLPWYASTSAIGTYAVAHKLINVVTTLLIVLASVYGPRFARLAEQRNGAELQQQLIATQQISTLIFVPAAALLILAASPLETLFNLPGSHLLPLLLILAAGHLVNAATGLSGVLLAMTGAAKTEMRVLLATCLTALVATPCVGTTWGMYGLAIMFSAMVAMKNLLSYLFARQQLNQLRSSSQ